jgi:hypothetical protein
MAWLGACGFRYGWQVIFERGPPAARTSRAKLRLATAVCVWSTVAGLLLTQLPGKFAREAGRVREAPCASEDWRVQALAAHASAGQWVFTDQLICAFWAGLGVPPPVAIVPLKRIWTGQIDSQRVLSSLEQYQPQQLLLQSDWETRFHLSEYIRDHYRLDRSLAGKKLYLRVR